MEVLIYNHSLYTAGVETLIVRMANWLVENGHGCSLVLRHTFDGDLLPQLRKEVNIRRVGNTWELLAIPGLRQLIWNKADLPTPDVVYTLEQSWASIGLLIRDVFPKGRTIAITGAYHPNQFCYEGRPAREGKVQKLRQIIYDRHYPDDAKFFMSDECLKGHEEFFQRPIQGGFIWPLPLELPDSSEVENRNIDPGIIMSVGRFSPFKTYNVYMADVIGKLRQKHPGIKWVVYGFGPEEEQLLNGPWKHLITEGAIEFRGMVPYHELRSVLARAKAFIGMGTALLEAGSLGVPSVPAIVYDTTACSYGYLHDLPYYTCGDPLPEGPPAVPVYDLLDRLLTMDSAEYATLSKKHVAYMAEYSTPKVMAAWVRKVSQLQSLPQSEYPGKFRAIYLFARICQIARARIFKRIPWI